MEGELFNTIRIHPTQQLKFIMLSQNLNRIMLLYYIISN